MLSAHELLRPSLHSIAFNQHLRFDGVGIWSPLERRQILRDAVTEIVRAHMDNGPYAPPQPSLSL